MNQLRTSLRRILRSILQFLNRPWYPFLVALLAGADLFVVVIPTDGLVVSAVLAKPRRWLWGAFIIGLGSACGGLLLSLLAQAVFDGGPAAAWLHELVDRILKDPDSALPGWIERHGLLAVVLGAVSPLPLQPFVVLPVFLGLTPQSIFGALLIGRILKYLLIGAVIAFVPRFLPKLKGIQDEVREVEDSQREISGP